MFTLSLAINGLGYVGSLIFLTSGCKAPQDLSVEGKIISFGLNGIKADTVRISESTGQIEIVVAYGTVLSGVTARIETSPNATVVPSAQTAQNFNETVYYTVTAAGGARKVYEVRVSARQQGAPVITGFSSDTVRAGESFIVSGQDFGRFSAALRAFLTDEAGRDISAVCSLIDSSRVRVGVPKSTTPGSYQVRVVKNNIPSASARKILVKIPAPEITAVKRWNIVQGDSIVLAGNYILPDRYEYRLRMVADKTGALLSAVTKETGRLTFTTDQGVAPGAYGLFLTNVQEGVSSQQANQKLRIYDAALPFVKGIRNAAADYKPLQTVELLTARFDKLPTRFYQIRLHSRSVDYNVNGIYSNPEKALSFPLPSQIKKGSYAITVFFISDSGQQLHDVDLDGLLIIKE